MKRLSLILAGLTVVALAALADWSIGVTGNRIDVSGGAIQAAGGEAPVWTPLDLSPLAYYTFNDTTNDISGNGKHLTWQGAASYSSTNALNGKCFRGNGASWLSSGTPVITNHTGGTRCSIAYWAYKGGVGTDDRGLVTQMDDNEWIGLITMINAAGAKPWALYYYEATWTDAVDYPPAWSAYQWTHWVVTSDGSVWRVYRDGTIVYTSSSMSLPVFVPVTFPMVIGSVGTTYGASGSQDSIDDVIIWNRTLTSNEVVQVYGYRE